MKHVPPWALVLIGSLALLPQAIHPLGMGIDLPDHLARVFIQANIGQDPHLAENYRVDRSLVPDIGMDVLLSPVRGSEALWIAGWGFSLVTLALLVGGAVVLSRRLHGRWSGFPLLAAAFLYGRAFEWGFLNFLFSQALALWAFILWTGTESWKPLPRIALFAAIHLLLFYTHAFGFLVFGFLFGLHELGRWFHREFAGWPAFLKRLAIRSIQFVPALILLVGVVAGPSGVPNPGTFWAGPVFNLTSGFGFVPAGVANVLTGAWLVLLVAAALTGSVRFDYRLTIPIIGMALLVAALPNFVLGIWMMGVRFVPLLALLIFAAIEFRPPRAPWRTLFAAGAVGLVGIQLIAAGIALRDRQALHRAVMAAVAPMERGAALLTASDRDPYNAVYWNLSGIAVIDKAAFVPSLFFDTSWVKPSKGRASIAFSHGRPLNRETLRASAAQPLPPVADQSMGRAGWHGWPETFDYLLWIATDPLVVPGVPLELVAKEREIQLYRIGKD